MTEVTQWWAEQPARLAWERDRLVDAGLEFKETLERQDDTASDRLVLTLSERFDHKDIPVVVVFPFAYPDFPPSIFGPKGLLSRNQSGDGKLCVPASEADWDPMMSVAELLTGPLRALLRDSESGSAAVSAGEVDMPEPRSHTLSLAPRKALVVPDPFWKLQLEKTRGKAVLYVDQAANRFLLQELKGVGVADSRVGRPWKGRRQNVVWAEIARPQVGASAGVLLEAAKQSPQVMAELYRLGRTRKGGAGAGVLLTFFEEGPGRGQTRRAWVLLVLAPDPSEPVAVVGAQALTQDERAVRTPELRGLDAARFLVVGAGSVGAPAALELAKAGAEAVTVVDADVYEVNNSVRHTLDVSKVTQLKAAAVTQQAPALNPFCTVEARELRVGTEKAAQELPQLVADHDVVIDAAGSAAAGRVLNQYTRQAKRVLITAGLTAGGYGADIAVLSYDGPCRLCLDDRRGDGSVPTPHTGAQSTKTPVGCGSPTFSAAGFEATELAANVARTAIRATSLTQYEPLDFDWAVLNFRTQPRWTQGTLKSSPDCQRCA